MMYPVIANQLYIQTDNILTMTFSTLTVLMNDVDSTAIVVSAAQFADIIRCINENHG